MSNRAMILKAVAALAAVALAAPGAPAQIAPSRSGNSSTAVIADAESWRTLVAFGNCFADRYPDQVLALMATQPGSATEARVYREVFRRRAGACLADTQMRMPRWIVRGAVVEGLYRRGVELPANLVQAAPAPGAGRTLTDAALCYAARHPDQVRALVADSRAASSDESEALSAMAPDFFRCVPPTYAGLRVDPTFIRYRLVEALLRLPASPAPAGKGD